MKHRWLFFLIQVISIGCACAETITSTAELPRIIILNGSSTAGKSSIARELQHILPDYCAVSYDTFREILWLSIAKELGLISHDYVFKNVTLLFQDVKHSLAQLVEEERKIKSQAWNPFAPIIDEKFYEHIAGLVLEGKKVIVDTIILAKKQVACIKKLPQNELCVLFVHVPLEVIIERISRRNGTGKLDEFRPINKVLFHYPLYYRATVSPNNVFGIETSSSLIEDIVSKASCLDCQWSVFPTGPQLAERMIKALGIQHSTEKIALMPRLTHDYFVDTGKLSSEEAALEIKAALLKERIAHSLFACDEQEIIDSLL